MPTITDADVRTQVQRYLDESGTAGDFDIDAIVDHILRDYGPVDIDDIADVAFQHIIQSHDVSAVSPRTDVQAVIEMFERFVRENPTLPKIDSFSVHFQAQSRAELDAVAGDFGLGAPSASSKYKGAQFGVHPRVPDSEVFAQMIVVWRDR